MNCAACKQILVLDKKESVKITYEVPQEFELIQGAEFAYLCNPCYTNGIEGNPDLWKNSQKEIEEI
jgi:hypothetical protein